ncbi:Type IV secretory system conjugative DNA transfer family protein [Sulfidibacter corallicola]|uniref:Type IV secretory system conjugative DNA transfer family protein n=1 Tax=Sulfidibacter corallicola TaxID=2818388 RepID=A0A8A4TMK3_SULCO|nr:type IV secretory system conjugative DNA transfer family protein [Sulfidibacter corallicola]QTD50687.1 type IV secretory system conjugative DNA transfer family protein [Sulfidibacter corallicola]
MLWNAVKSAAKFGVGYVLTNRKGGKLLRPWQARHLLSHRHRGLVVDGYKLRLSEKSCFNHCALIAGTGWGKTTSFVIPNLYRLARSLCSLVVTDPKGEIHALIGGYLRQRGFHVVVLNPANVDASDRYNPFAHIRSSRDLNRMAAVIMGWKDSSREEEKFWIAGAVEIFSILAEALIRRGSRCSGLHNVYRLLLNFGGDGRPLDSFMVRTCNQGNREDHLFNRYLGFVEGNARSIQTFVTVAGNALRGMADVDFARLLGSNDVDFRTLRTEKTAVFLCIPPNSSEYQLMVDLFVSQLFDALMQRLPSKKELNVYCFLDEFGNMSLPNFGSTLTTIRAYRVSISILLQSLSQLEDRYGASQAKTILQGGIGTKIFGTAEAETADYVERIIGRRRGEAFWRSPLDPVYEVPLLSAAEVRALDERKALLVARNSPPVLLETTPWYEQPECVRRLKRATRREKRFVRERRPEQPMYWVNVNEERTKGHKTKMKSSE